MADLSKVGERSKLKSNPGKQPHWQRLRRGCFVGYRPAADGGPGTWIARAYDDVATKYRVKSLGDFGDLPGSDRFAAAKGEAEGFAVEVETGGLRDAKLETVADACRAYSAKGNDKATLERLVYGDPIAAVKLDRLRRHHLEAWRGRLTGKPSTINRAMVPLRAALKRVKVDGPPGTDAAWQEALRPASGADGRRALYLDRAERQRLLQAMEPAAQAFFRAMLMLPLRPGALAGLKVADFDKRTGTLSIGTDKSGRPRQLSLPDNITAFLTKQGKGKLPGAWLFTTADGRQWNRDSWQDPIRAAREAARLPSGTTAYVLRHCVLTDLVVAGVPLLTVAQLADTSVAMIERHYGHLTATAAKDALARLAL
ncbi:tyrosine-type recombinase/integrase [Croceibacterium aestuarii]|uniref:tyrosine-type recombinase/integrase n=1 Tax=Croceibacterium aestuarii TaxID=3064139 RepID=UPI00272DCDF0|nr:tyrosine-type recombinase/integrase [Croceibacterium sp. D39]